MIHRLLPRCTILAVCFTPVVAAEIASLKFDFGSGTVAPGYVQALPDMLFSNQRGYGFEPGATLSAVDRGGDSLRGDFITSGARPIGDEGNR